MTTIEFELVGTVAALFQYPVKSMAARALSIATVDRYGVVGDRRFALRRRGVTNGFPWLTATRAPALVEYQVVRSGLEHASSTAELEVRAPSGTVYNFADASFATHIETRFGHAVDAMHLDQGMFDWSGLSLITLQTIRALEGLVGFGLDARRFRPNIVVDATDTHIGLSDAAVNFPEDPWVGSTLVVGDPSVGVAIALTALDVRCSMINLDPDTGYSDPRVMRAVVKKRSNLAGVYGVPTREGVVAVGDRVYRRFS